MTSQYYHQGRAEPLQACEKGGELVCKWLHSVLDEPDFKTEWHAAESALALAFELDQPMCLRRSSLAAPPPKKIANKCVRFRQLAEVCIGDSQILAVPMHAFHCWPAKPWSLVEDWSHQPDYVLRKYRAPCFPPSWHSMTAFQFPHHSGYYSDGVPHHHLRIMDEFVNLPHIPDDDGNPHLPGHVPNGQPAQVPDFTNNMLAQMDPLLATPANFGHRGVVVRTWYIHHETAMRNDSPRLVQLGLDRENWVQQMVAVWQDVLLVGVPKAFTLPTPMPFRGHAHQFIALDVIISQGLHIPRFSGLVSVHFLDDLDGLQSSIVAASFPSWVSGYHVVSAADVHEYCAPISGRACSIFHGWDQIPVDALPHHRMRPGNSFMIQVPNDPNIEVGGSQAASGTQAAVQAFGMPDGSAETYFDPAPPGDDPGDDEPEDSPADGTPPHDSLAAGPLFNCHFYRMRHPPLHIFMRNAAGVPMLRELAQQLGVPPASLLQAHAVQARMSGDQIDDWSFVLQSVTDLPAASTDALVILDVEVHFHPTLAAAPPLPATARRVVRVPLHITRQAVLEYAGVNVYCRAQQHRCLVQVNGAGWPILHPGPRTMSHGKYLRVIVPPPLDGSHALQAIHVAQSQGPGLLHPSIVRPRQHAPAPAPMPSASPASTPAPQTPGAASRASRAQPTPPPLANDWFGALVDAFDRDSLLEHEEEGPVMYVWTWFINHITHQRCSAPRIVRLDELRNLWLEDLYQPWQHEIDVQAPTTVGIVHGQPPQASFSIDAIHVMIEQHPTEARAAAVLSAMFHGQSHDRLLQVGRSMPRWTCMEDVIDILAINHICEGQRCSAFIGRIPMQQFIRQDIPSASCIEVHVRPPQCPGDSAAASSTEAYVPRTIMATAAHSLVQIATRWRRASTLPSLEEEAPPADHMAEHHLVAESSSFTCEFTAPGAPPAFALPWPTTWRTLEEAWAFFIGHHADQFPDGVRAEVWYSDHVRMPWSEAGRVVHLPLDFSQWTPLMVQAWDDWFSQEHGFEISVVSPSPIGGDNVVHFHVIIVQQPLPESVSCILTVMDRFADPWAPGNVCVLLPNAVDHWMLLAIAVVDFQCPPADPGARCTTLYGNLELTAGNLFPVQQAMCFTITVESNGPLPVLLPGVVDVGSEEIQEVDATGLLQLDMALSRSSQMKEVVLSPLQDVGCDVDSCAVVHAQMVTLSKAFGQALSALQLVDTHSCLGGSASAGHDPQPPGVVSSSLLTSKAPRVVLSLEASLAPPGDPDQPSFDESLSTLQWLHHENWEHCCKQMSPVALQPLPDGLHVPLETYFAMTDSSVVQPCTDAQWELYVDGATSITHAAWSVVVVKADATGTTFHGQLSGNVVLDRTNTSWIGADSLDNIAAEFEAFLIALLLVHSEQLPGRVVVRPDLQLSQGVAAFSCSTCSNPILATLIRQLAYWMGTRLEVVEVRGHQGHPWNELADSLAKMALGVDIEEVDPAFLEPLHQFAVANMDAQWAWLQKCPTSLLHAFPPLCDGQVMQFPFSLRRIGLSSSGPSAAVGSDATTCQLSLLMATANVLALDPARDLQEAGRRVGLRTQRLDAQWHSQKFHILGLQEARTAQGVYFSEHYKIWSSGHAPEATCLGCEVWCHRTLPLATLSNGQALCLDAFRVTVLHADPRRMLVRFEHDCLQFTVVALRTPCLRRAHGPGQRTLDEIKNWWDETSALLDAKVVDAMVWLLVDANAPLATEETALVGGHGAEPMNPQGRLFESFIDAHQFFVPCTFDQYHKGPSATWTHPSGAKLRRDYVLVSKDVASFVMDSFVLVDHDSTFAHEDHLPACLRVETAFQVGARGQGRVQWDPLKLQDPVVVAKFQAALATLPLPTWDVNIDEHCRIFEANLLQLARQFFEKTTRSRSRPQLAASTLSCIAFKRHLLDCGRAWHLMNDPNFKEEMKAVEKEVKQRVQHDLQVYYDQLLVRLQNAGDLNNLKEMHRLLTRIGSRRAHTGFKPHPLPALRKPDGSLATSFSEQQMIWMRQFGAIEAGQQMHWQELQRLDRPGFGPPLDTQTQELFPSPWKLQSMLRKLKHGKTPGLNMLPPDVLKAGAGPFCTQLCALTTKAVAHCKEPLSWKGGLLVPLSKGKPDTADPLGYRSIFISDFTAKLYHMTLREHLVQVWEKGITSPQLGGRRRMGADLAHHLLQAHGHWAASQRIPYAHLFFDISSAFYSVLRQALLPGDEPELSLIAALHRFKVSAADIDYMIGVTSQDDATAGINDHFRRLLKDALTNTHFFIQGLDAPCRTTRGTRPGDPLGDLLYNVVMNLVLKDARARIIHATGVHWCGSPEPCSSMISVGDVPREALLDFAFVDDCAMAVHALTISRVLQVVQASVHAMATAAKGRGLLLNYAAGKTEVVLHLVGRGSRDAKIQLQEAQQKLCWTVDEVPYELRVVHCYKHLGTWIQQGAKGRKEILARGAAAKQAWGALHRSLYSKKYVSVRSKTMVFASLSMSRLLYNVHVWAPLSQEAVEDWQNSIRKPLSVLARGHTFGVSPLELTVDTLCGLLQMLPPADLLHMARLRYLRRLVSTCPTVLWQLLMATKDLPNSWLQACALAFGWFRKFYSDHFGMPQTDDIHDWLPVISLDPNWKGRVKAAGRACKRFRQAEAEAVAWQKRFEASFTAAGGLIPDAPPISTERWMCDLCNKTFGSKRALAAHSARLHGYRHVALLYGVDHDCQACCRRYHNRSRLVEHLRDAHGCLQTLQACFPPINDEQLRLLDEQEKQDTMLLKKDGWGCTKALHPMRRLAGPGLPPPGSVDAQNMRDKYSTRHGDGSLAAQQLQGRREGPVDEPQQVHLFAADFPAFVLQSPHGFQVGHGAFDSGGLAQNYARLNLRSLVFVHFFSGYRRPGDLHAHLDHRVLGPGLELHVISVDLCLQREHGNLLAPDAHGFWRKQISSGRVIGAGGGPPCETFSAARMQADGPRPLRHADYLFGLPNLTKREWMQVLVGTRLLHFLLDQLLLLAVCGGCGFCEHPQFPVWMLSKAPPSIWTHPAVRALRLLRCCGITSFDQCIFGALATKPTTILHVRLPVLRERVLACGHMGRCQHGAKAHVQLQGFEADGTTFRTARCKVYPPGLNAALADSIECHARLVSEGALVQPGLPTELQPFTHANFAEDCLVQPDFYPHLVQA